MSEALQDVPSPAWLAPMLAHAGRYAEAVAAGPRFEQPRPRAREYAVLVTALWQLGRQDEAAELMALLQRKFRGLRSEFVHIWADDPLSQAFRAAYRTAPAHHGALPVFQHLPFCAGTSMQFSQRQAVPAARTLQISRRRGLLQIRRAMRLPQSEIDRLLLVHQHHPYPLHLPGRRLSHFTVLRDPVSQLRSGFYKRQRRDKIISTRDRDSVDFGDHVDYLLSAGLTNLQSRMIVSTHPELQAAYRRRFRLPGSYRSISCEEDMFWVPATRRFSEEKLLRLARETLDENFAVVGTMAHLAAGHLACSAAIGLPLAHRIVHRGRSGQPPTSGTATGFGSVERRLADANSVDQQLFELYTERFEQRHPELITAVESVDAVAPV